MKKQITLLLATLFLLSGSAFCQTAYNTNDKDSVIHISQKLKGTSLWGEFNIGYSNNGTMGNATLNYRKGNIYVGTSYYKSHICYDDSKQHDHFLNIKNSQDHKTIQSIAVFSGIVLRGKWSPSFIIGISWLQFDYVNTIPIKENVTLERIWETIIGEDYKNEKLGSKRVNTIGIPIGMNVHLGSKHFAGLDASLNANLNTHSIFVSGGIGIHIGRIISRS
ncbi:MAG TPA: hypothetical protein VKT28_05135 [Puia sp.]|nr:hypothetical protein [Puia sp.]